MHSPLSWPRQCMNLDLFLMYYFCKPCLLTLNSKQEMTRAFSFLRTCLLRYRKLLFQALFSLNCLYLSLGEAVISVLAVSGSGRNIMELAPGVFIQHVLSCPACCRNVTTPHITANGMATYPHGFLPTWSASSRTSKFCFGIFSFACMSMPVLVVSLKS